jgi:hypothetical protein
MKIFFTRLLSSILILSVFFIVPASVKAVSWPPSEETGAFLSIIGAASKAIVPISGDPASFTDDYLKGACADPQNRDKYIGGGCAKDSRGQVYSPGVLGVQQKFVSMLYDNQISSEEYVADILDNIGVPSVNRAYAQGTGYTAMKPFLEFWKVFRNLAYSLYIIMFVVVGIMIMLRTKVNAQTIITIQTALPNLLITLLLITFSYAIVGFMIDIMYFLIYFIVYLVSSVGIVDASQSITRLMSHSAWSVIFEGRNSIISAISSSIGSVLWSLGKNGVGVAGAALSFVSPMYLIVAVAFAIAMLKLMLALVKAYIMLIVQTITAPVQILMNAMPGSKAFSTWLKTTASYLIPFPVAACMFLFSAILVGNPTNRTNGAADFFSGGGADVIGNIGGSTNPFGVNDNAALYQDRNNLWLPPFTLTNIGLAEGDNSGYADILTIIGFVIFLMTPASVKMAQDWLQVKESPYTAEALGNVAMGGKAGAILPSWGWKSYQEELAAQRSAKALGGVIGNRGKNPFDEKPNPGGD